MPVRPLQLSAIRRATALAALLPALAVAGCGSIPLNGFTQNYQRGYVLDENALQQVPVGSSQEQVLLVLGTPSTVATRASALIDAIRCIAASLMVEYFSARNSTSGSVTRRSAPHGSCRCAQ